MNYCIIYLQETDGDIGCHLCMTTDEVNDFVSNNDLHTDDYFVLQGENIARMAEWQMR